jgi:hypothetical protein
MTINYKIFRLDSKEVLERDGWDIATTYISKLREYGSDWHETERDAVNEIPSDGYKYVVLKVYS